MYINYNIVINYPPGGGPSRYAAGGRRAHGRLRGHRAYMRACIYIYIYMYIYIMYVYVYIYVHL